MSQVKNLPTNAEDITDTGWIPGSGRFPGGEHGNPFQYSYLENPMDRGYGVHDLMDCGITKRQICLSTHGHTLVGREAEN